MIRSDMLHEFRPAVRFKDHEGIALQSVIEAIRLEAERWGVPVGFYRDRVRSGGWFRSDVRDCVVLYHPRHGEDYCKFCICVGYQGVYAFLSVDYFGHGSLAQAESVGNNGGEHQQKLEEEQRYYARVAAIIDEIIA